MISSIIDAVLLSALVATSISVMLMYRRLQRFDALQSEAAAAFVQSAQALEKARQALDALQDGGGELAVSLAARMNEARLIMNDLERGTAEQEAVNATHAATRYAETAHERIRDVAQANTAATQMESAISRQIEAAWGDRFAGLRAAAEASEAARYGAHGHPLTAAPTRTNVPAVLQRAIANNDPRHV